MKKLLPSVLLLSVFLSGFVGAWELPNSLSKHSKLSEREVKEELEKKAEKLMNLVDVTESQSGNAVSFKQIQPQIASLSNDIKKGIYDSAYVSVMIAFESLEKAIDIPFGRELEVKSVLIDIYVYLALVNILNKSEMTE